MAERRTSRRLSTPSPGSPTQQGEPRRSSNPNVFSDEYALESLQISGGFGVPLPNDDVHDPNAREALQPAPTDNHGDAQLQQNNDHVAPHLDRSFGSRKSGYNERHSSLLSRSDGTRQFLPYSTRASVYSNETPASTLLRSASRASTSTMPRTQSPYQGATGPSHPYGMYPQGTGVLRTPSTATTSTVTPRERSYTGPSDPTYPYGMYPQNTVPEDEISPAQNLPLPAAVGFPGRTPNYRRRLGPDAEDADELVGPDGYSEPLPPYTRYPDGIPPKHGGPGPASILSAERGQQGSSEETLANPFQSRESLPQHNQATHSSAELTALAESDSPEEDEGGNFKERVKKKGRKRICFGAIPMWVIALLVILMVAVLAGVIGAVVGRARGEQQAASAPPPTQRPSPVPAGPATVVVTTTSLVDATPLPSTPANLPTLPTGIFYVPLQNLTISNNSCLSSHAYAWGCSHGADLKLDLSVPKMVSVSPRFPSTPNQVHFGPQPPQMDQPVPLQLMGDKNGMDRGPAWFFQQSYTKVVVVPGPFWEFDHGNTRRWFDLWRGRSSSRRLNPRGDGGIAPAAAKPWFCYWNNTILEGFIYVTQNSSGRVQPASTEYPWPSSPTGDYDPPAAAWSINSDQPPAMFTSFPPANPTMATGSMHKRQTPDPSELSAYTKVVKIEERRDPDVVLQPYCVHMQIMNDGTAQPLPEPSITLTATEPEDDESNYQPSRLRRRGPLFERDSSTSACECEWVSS